MAKNLPTPPTYSAAGAPATLDALKDAVGFVAEGRPVSQQLATALRRMLAQLQERTDIVQIVLDHHQMQRLVTTMSRLTEVEDFFFANTDPDFSLDSQLKGMQAKDRLALLVALQREVGTLVQYSNQKSSSQSPMKSAPNEVQEAAEQQTDAQLDAASRSGAVPQEGRERIRAAMEKLVASAASVIDVQAEPLSADEQASLATLEETISPEATEEPTE